MNRRLASIAVSCGALLACHAILGIGELDVPPEDDSDSDFDFDTSIPPRDASRSDVFDASTSDVDAGGVKRRVFIMAATIPNAGGIGGVEGGNAKCRDAATKAGLGGDWVAWLSDSTHRASDALTFDGTYELLNGTQIAVSKAALLSGSLLANINVTESKGTIGGLDTTGVWTGTKANGDLGAHCNNWTESGAFGPTGTGGSPQSKDAKWTEYSNGISCAFGGRLYCFER